MARNLAIDWLRRGQRASRLISRAPFEEVATEVPDSTDKGAREVMAAKEERSAVHEAILDLPVEQREVVLLHFTEELTQEQIAERLGVHQTTVSRQIQRALKSLRGTLEPVLRQAAPALRAPRAAPARASREAHSAPAGSDGSPWLGGRPDARRSASGSAPR